MKYLNTLLFLLAFIALVIAQTNPNHVWVNSYYRKNGTYVRGYYKTAPNHTNVDNFSTKGNINPYTLEPGWIRPDGQDNPWDNEDEVERENINIEPYYGSSTYNYKRNTNEVNSKKSIEVNSYTSSNKTNSDFWYSKGDQVNVRFTPDINSKIAYRINKGDLVKILNKSETQDYIYGYGNDYWYEVSYNNLTGWVFGKLIGERNYNSTDIEKWNGDLVMINTNSVNLRTEPDTKVGKIILKLEKYLEIEILAKTTQTYNVSGYGTNYWYYIKANNITGWVFGSLIDF